MTAFRSPPKADEVDRKALLKRVGGVPFDEWLVIAVYAALAVGILVKGILSGKTWMIIASLFVGAVGAVAVRLHQRRAQRRRTALQGLVGSGLIVSVKSFKSRSVVFLLEVAVEGYDRFHAEAPERTDPLHAARLVGENVPIVWHPKRPAEVLIASLPEPAAPRLGPQGPPRRKRRK
jgi:hypothetical protein